ncbi:hemerythrin domain-containing protein [Acidimicrobiia bacterium EGI L10123]|uniref:hemerythrin domain-containing protein n=1 Tax=Salinilacustrithrix flava TaxID=2957203 RepID=UPI003D7C159D|nr:hemerythrin domain-containing protein [Acidimicrobiia bacterium EGI L10123]
MNVIQLLENDHREVDELFRRVHLSEKPETIDELTKQIVHDLSVHAAVEEQFVYPLLRAKVDGGGAMADEAIEEHQQAKRLLADLEELDAGSADHAKAMESLIETIRHHVEEEEADVFPKLRDEVGASTLDSLGDLVEQAKKVVPTHPHPLVPGTATAQLVAGPWAATVDKVRDLLGGR